MQKDKNRNLYSRYIQLKNNSKESAVPWTNPNYGLTLEQANTYNSYAGVLSDDVVVIDADIQEKDPQKGLTTIKTINEYITKNNIKCKIVKTTHGMHYYFKKPESERNIGRHCPAVLCSGLVADYIVSPAYLVLKLNNKEREVIQDPEELDELPVPFRLAVADKTTQSKYQFYNAGHGERYAAISGFKLVLMKKGLNQEEIEECLNIACSLFGEKYDSSKIRNICKITDKEEKKIATSKEEKKIENKMDLYEEAARKFVRTYQVARLETKGYQLIYKPTLESDWKEIDHDSLISDKMEELVGHTFGTNALSNIKTMMYALSPIISNLEAYKYVRTNNGYYIDTKTFQVTTNYSGICSCSVNANYDSSISSSTKFDSFMSQIASNDKEVIDVLWEIIAESLFPRMIIKKIHFLIGNGSNGKSTIINIIEKLTNNRSTVPMEDWKKDSFDLHNLIGSTFNSISEIAQRASFDTDVFKNITGCDSIQAKVKFQKDASEFKNTATHICACNDMARFTHIDEALTKRLYIVRLFNKFSNNDNFLSDLMTEDVKSYILNKSIEVMKKLAETQKHSPCKNADKELTRYIADRDFISRFLGQLALEKEVDIYTTPLKDIYEDYQRIYLETYGKRYFDQCLTISQFGKALVNKLQCAKFRDWKGQDRGATKLVKLNNSKDLSDFIQYAEDEDTRELEKTQEEYKEESKKLLLPEFCLDYYARHPELNVYREEVYNEYQGKEIDEVCFGYVFAGVVKCIITEEEKPRFILPNNNPDPSNKKKKEDNNKEQEEGSVIIADQNDMSREQIITDLAKIDSKKEDSKKFEDCIDEDFASDMKQETSSRSAVIEEPKTNPAVIPFSGFSYGYYKKDAYNKGLVFFDFEVFKNDWLVVFKYCNNQEATDIGPSVVIVNDRNELIKYYTRHVNDIWVGYNAKNYDKNILRAIVNGLNPYDISSRIINGEKGLLFNREVYMKTPLNVFDVQILGKSLKQLEGFMGNDIEETEVDFNLDRKLTQEEIDLTTKYCTHDVEQTIEVFKETKGDFEARLNLVKEYKLPVKEIGRTKPSLSALILGCPDNKEDRKEFNDEWDIELVDTIRVEKHKDVLDWYKDPSNYKDGQQLMVEVNGIPHTFGLGGLHGAPGSISETKTGSKSIKASSVVKEGLLVHLDVQSFYPSQMIQYGLISRNVGKPELYKQIYEKRLELKKQGEKKIQKALKIVLNSTYGIFNDKTSGAYDPKIAHEICINGQLLLLDLLEKIEGKCELIQSNTDGIIVWCKNEEELEVIKGIAKEWETRTRMGLEVDVSKKIIQKDVNNYLLVNEDCIETKGIYLKENSLIDNDLPILNEALIQYLVKGTPIEDTINNCQELIKFQKIVKLTTNYKKAWHNGEYFTNKTYRVFASTDENDTAIKKLKEGKETPDKFGNTPEHCFIFNASVKGVEFPSKLDRSWYIKEAKKRLESFEK